MHDPTAIVWRCTAQLKSGRFCDQPSIPDAEFPICLKHARAAHDTYADLIGDRPSPEQLIEFAMGEWRKIYGDRLREPVRNDPPVKRDPFVYYVRIADHIKIGYSTRLRQRLRDLRVDPDALMAAEPGGRDLERRRHLEFAEERIGRREDFHPSGRLLAHIEAVRAEHGDLVERQVARA